MPANTRPDWVADEGPDAADLGADPAMMAEIERAMAARGYTDPPAPTPAVPQGGDASGPSSNQATNLPAPSPEGLDAGTSTPSADAPAAQTAGGAPPATPGSEALPPPVEGSEQEPPTPTSLKVILPSGDPFEMTNDQANYLIQLHNWIESKPAEVRKAWKALEDGTHAALPKSDVAAYEAWVAAGRPTATQPALERPAFDPQFVDQNFLDYVAKLEAKVKTDNPPHSTVPQQAPQPSPVDVQTQATALANRQVRVQQALDQTTAAIRDKYNLSPEQVAHLSRITPELGIIPGIAERHRTYSPLGDLLSDAPMDVVFTEAFETAMATDPTLRAVRDEMIVQHHLAANSETMKNVASKKANASSLATAPSAAVPGMNLDPSKMTQQQRHEAMVAELAAAMAEQGQG